MARRALQWWHRLRVQQKVWTILIAIFVSLTAALSVHVLLINHLLAIQSQRQHIIMAREQLHILRRHMVDIEGAFRGYLLTEQDVFLEPLVEAESKMQPVFVKTLDLIPRASEAEAGMDIRELNGRLAAFLKSKQRLIEMVRSGRAGEAR